MNTTLPGHLFIALYNKSKTCKADHHWGAVISTDEPGTNSVAIYQIEADEQGRWVLNRRTGPLQANDDIKLLGLVRLPETTPQIPAHYLMEYVDDYTNSIGPPEDFNVHIRPWTCADWVIRVVKGPTEDFVLFDISQETKQGFYEKVTDLGLAFERGIIKPNKAGIRIADLV